MEENRCSTLKKALKLISFLSGSARPKGRAGTEGLAGKKVDGGVSLSDRTQRVSKYSFVDREVFFSQSV